MVGCGFHYNWVSRTERGRKLAFPHPYLVVKLQGVCDVSPNLTKHEDQLFSRRKDVPRRAHWPIQPRTLKGVSAPSWSCHFVYSRSKNESVQPVNRQPNASARVWTKQHTRTAGSVNVVSRASKDKMGNARSKDDSPLKSTWLTSLTK